MIEQIKIRNFRSIRELDLELTPINVLIGSNGVGKSNFIAFFKLVNQIYEEQLGNYVGKQGSIDNVLYFGQKTSEYLYGLLNFDNTNAYYFRLEPSNRGTFYFSGEGDFWNGYNDDYFNYERWHRKELGSGHTESLIKDTKGFRSVYLKKYLKNFKIYHFHDTSSSAKIKQPCKVDDNKYLREDASNLAAFLYLLQETHPKRYRKIERIINSVAPFFDRFDLAPSRNNSEYIELEWKEKGSDMYLNAHNLSDGTLRFMALVVLLLQPDLPETIIMDEPELGLHPFAINKLSGLIKKAAASSQIILSTQSVNLVNNFEPEDIVTVDRADQQSIFKRLSSEELKDWLDGYSLGELWTKNIIGGRP